MSAHTKKHHTNQKKLGILRIEYGQSKRVFKNVPLKSVEKLVNPLMKFLDEKESQESLNFENAYKKHFETIGGEKAYRLSAHAVKTCRIETGMTQNELAQIIETDQAHISNIERARKPIGKRLAQKLSAIFKKHNASFFLSELPQK